ncbi:MAG TPA: TonB-dependent receptor [Acidobacteriota bacterium]|nr:TonB-dependent receptor [Acidobacteriota bacterium]
MVSARFPRSAPARYVRFASLALLLLAPPLPSRARADDSEETPRYRLEPVVVTAGRMPLPLDRVPSDLVVIGRERLERDRPMSAADALRSVPGIDVQRAGRLGKITDVRLRGADPRHTLVLFDGIPLNGPWVGSFDFADLGASGWSQIEVMGGPASALYGSGAVGGVIQFLGGGPAAGAAEGLAARAFTEYGGEATHRQSASLGSRGEGRSLSLSLARVGSEGSGTRDAYRGWNATARAEAALDRATTLRLTGLLTHGVKELPYNYVFDFGDFRVHQVEDPNYEERDRVTAGGALLTRALGANAALEAEVTGLAGRIVNDNPENTAGGDYQDTRLDNSRWIGSFRARAAAGSRIRAIAGGEYRSEHANRDDDAQYGGFAYPSSVDEAIRSRALFAQAHLDPLPRVVLDAGLRVEDHARYGAYGVPRVSASFAVGEWGLRFRGGYGRAFTAPTLTDLYYPGYGSPSLRPERSRTWEAGLDGRWLDGRVEARVTWHETRFQDLIQANSLFTAENIGRARIEGTEASVRVRLGRGLALGARAAHLPVAKNLASGDRLGKRPRWRTGGDAEWEATRALRLHAAWRWSDSFHDPFDFVDAGGRYLDGDTPGYAALDLAAALKPARWPFGVRVRVENALDREITEVKGLPARGRLLALGLELLP